MRPNEQRPLRVEGLALPGTSGRHTQRSALLPAISGTQIAERTALSIDDWLTRA